MKSYYFLFGEGSKINQILCAILINLPVFAYGASIGWMSPMTLLLQSPRSPRGTPLTDTEVSWMGSSSYLVCIAGNFLMATMCDRVGRKSALLFMSITAALSWILKLSSMEPWALIGARALVGLTMSGAYVTCPLYVKDISDRSLRGALGTLVTVAHTSGNLFLYIIGDYMSYRGVLWVCLSLPAAHLALVLLMPESPVYLLKLGKLEEARRVMSWLRCRPEADPLLDEELVAIRRELAMDDRQKQRALRAIVSDSVLLRAFCISMAVGLAREVCGAIPVLNFAGEIFERASTSTPTAASTSTPTAASTSTPTAASTSAAISTSASHLALSANQQAIVLGAVQVVASTIASAIIEKTGRKPLLAVTAFVSGLSMCVLASWFVAREYHVTAPEWIPVGTLCICIFCDAAGLQPLAVVIIGEIFSYKYRGTVMAVVMSAASLADFLQMLFFKPVANSIGVHVAFYFFGSVCLLAAVYVILVVPETKNRTVQQIYDELRKNKRKKTNTNDTNTNIESH